MPKNVLAGFSRPGIPGVQAILTADKPNHARLRRNLAPAFNDQAVKGYEAKIAASADVLIDRLNAKTHQHMVVDLNKYFEWVNLVLFNRKCETLTDSPRRLWT